MKKSNPISLFSFQDIITSLTGIMIVVVLVILLQIVESADKAVQNIEQNPENIELAQRKKALSKQKEELRKRLKNMVYLDQPYAELSEEELVDRIESETVKLKAVKKEIAAQEEKLKKELEIKRKLESDSRETRQKTEKFAEKNKLNDLELKVHQLREEAKRLQNEIASRRKHVDIQIESNDDQTPLVVECSSWGFRVKMWPSGNLTVIGQSGDVIGEAEFEALGKLVKNRPERSFFIVLLMRKEAFPKLDEIMQVLEETGKKIEYGKELINNDEDCLS